jgi:hypothetical protein
MTRKNTNYFVIAIIISYLGLNYLPNHGWWISMLGTLFIIFFGRKAWSKNYLQRLGIPQKTLHYFISIVLLIVFTLLTYALIITIVNERNYGFTTASIYKAIHIFFYTLNEEIVLGALLLFSLSNKYNKANPIFISITIAFIFAIMHYIFYRWIFPGEAQGILSFFTITTLFVVGVLRNNLILKFGHIGYSWAVHYSWMLIMFGCAIYYKTNNILLSETERFNIFIGNKITFIAALVTAVLTSIWIIFDSNKTSVEPGHVPAHYKHN